MNETRHAIPEWVTRGKTIRQLIKELQSFENQDLVVRMSLDDGDTNYGISLVQKDKNGCCLLVNSEKYYESDWQQFMDRDATDTQSHDGEPSPT